MISESEEAALRQRNQHIKTINEDGVLAWRRTSGYYRQSEAENVFFRYKKLFGDALNARNENSRLVESVIACNILNQFRLLGRPEYELAGCILAKQLASVKLLNILSARYATMPIIPNGHTHSPTKPDILVLI